MGFIFMYFSTIVLGPLLIDPWIVEAEDLTYTTVAHTPSEADITCIADITVISHAKQRLIGTGVSHSY